MSIHVSSEDLAAYLDGTLDQEAKAIAEGHLADCSQCRGEMLDVRQLLSDLAATQRAQRRRRRLNRSLVWIATGAAAVVVLSLGLLRPPTGGGYSARSPVERGAAPANRIAVVAPVANGTIDIPNVIFIWHAKGPGATYRLTIMDSAGVRLLSKPTPDTAMSLPIAPPLGRGRTYLWYVDALASDGHTVTSGVRSFSTGR